jgi:hypothetical protein
MALIAAGSGAWAEPAVHATPEAAVAALLAALEARDRAAVLTIFGPEAEDILSTGDAEEDRELWGAFLDNARERARVERDAADRATLMVGRELWPFPAPLVLGEGGWRFDAEAARDEVLMRRIGRNELAVIGILRRAGAVQRLYRGTDHDGDGVMEFAASILSSPGARDGLYGPDTPGAAPSPFDATLARASFSGYGLDGEDREPEPFEGYYFRILQRQGPAAPGGAYSYMINGNMVAGHAVLASPAVYGDTGIMSFLVGENGIVLEADLGEDTLQRALALDLYDPDEKWTPVD